MKTHCMPAAVLMTALSCAAFPALAADAAAAEALMKKSNCSKCHSVAAKKNGPSFKETAAKYKGKTPMPSRSSSPI